MITFHPVTPERWKDMTDLFGLRGACGGCWCMWWRIKRSEFDMRKGAGNRRAMKRIVDSGEVPGILAYDGTEPLAYETDHTVYGKAKKPKTSHVTARNPDSDTKSNVRTRTDPRRIMD